MSKLLDVVTYSLCVFCALCQVTRLAGKGTAGVACGHSYTAAVQCDGSLHTWGSGLGGQLGLGPNVTTAVWPTRIFTGLEGVRSVGKRGGWC